MKTKAELEKDIISITLKIYTGFPELSNYVSEMPEIFSGKDNSPISAKKYKEYHHSLEGVLLEYTKNHVAKNEKKGSETLNVEGYPLYPPSEDIYNQEKVEQYLNPEDISKNKTPNTNLGTSNENEFDEDRLGDDLDVPGSELDDQQERIGSEDEENNYYSLGGENHNDLEEDKG